MAQLYVCLSVCMSQKHASLSKRPEPHDHKIFTGTEKITVFTLQSTSAGFSMQDK